MNLEKTKLVLGAGFKQREDAVNNDILKFDGIDWVWNLNDVPWNGNWCKVDTDFFV